ncbi:MAG: MATE family efflux transporter [Eubacteriales bacterium]|nr:MATE family efflux transporter [Eubacteriales bacterium]
MQDEKNFLGTEPVGKLLLKLALPAIAAQLINLLYNMVDRIYIGHIPETGALALTGVGVCMPVIMIVSAFAALVSMGGAPRASIYMGKQDNDMAEKILGNCLTLQIVISAALTAILLLFNRPLLLTFGASENTIDYAVSYMRIYAIGTVFVQLTLGMNAFITGQGFARTGMLSVLIGAVCNIILDPVFIFGLGLGVGGAALATIISQGVSTVWVLAFLSGKKTILKIRKKNIGINGSVILPCMALGISPFIMQSSESVIMVCFNSSLLKYGGDIAVGAMTILTSVMQFSMLPMQGIAQGAQPVSSYNFGAGNADRVKATFKLLLAACLTYSMALWLAIMITPQFFARIFTPDRDLVAFTGTALRIYAGGMGLMGAQIACQMTFISLGNAIASVIVAVVRKFVLLIPLIYTLPHFLQDKTMAVYTAEPVADVIAVTFTVILFSFQFRKAMKKLETSVCRGR